MKFAELAYRALRTINAIGQGIPVQPNDLTIAFEAANDMIDAWAAQRLTIFQNLRFSYPIVPGQGTPSDPYTIGIGGDLNQARPLWIDVATLQDNSNTPVFELNPPLAILTPDEYARIPIKTLSASLANSLYYNGRFKTSGVGHSLGEIFLYPVPNGGQDLNLCLYCPVAMTEFADIATTEYYFPPGYREALRYQLAKRLAVELGKPVSAELEQMATDTFAVLERPNVPIENLRADYGLPGLPGDRGIYNWRDDSGRY